MGGESVAVAHRFTRLKLVNRAAIGALGMAFAGHIKVDLGVVVPQLHVSLGAGAKNTTLGVQVFCQEFNRMAHGGIFLRLNGG